VKSVGISGGARNKALQNVLRVHSLKRFWKFKWLFGFVSAKESI
jgi:hypothetical protein